MKESRLLRLKREDLEEEWRLENDERERNEPLRLAAVEDVLLAFDAVQGRGDVALSIFCCSTSFGPGNKSLLFRLVAPRALGLVPNPVNRQLCEKKEHVSYMFHNSWCKACE